MTNEDFIFGLLMESELLGIRKEVLELSHKIKEEDKSININVAIEKSFQIMKSKLQEYNNV